MNPLIQLLSASLTIRMVAVMVASVGLSAYAIPYLIRIAQRRRLFDTPDGERKLHGRVVPTLGGLPIFVSFLIIYAAIGRASELPSFAHMVSGLLILFFIGLKDDLLNTSPRKKLVGQLVASGLVIAGGVTITNLGGVFGVGAISYPVSVILTLFTFIVVINAYNLIDGIDGLAGGIGLIASAAFGFWFLSVNAWPLGLMGLALSGALAGFLLYNFEPAKIFMGDTGSMVVGYLLAFMSVEFVEMNTNGVTPNALQHIAPVYVLAVLIVPLYDTLRVFGLRALMGKSPFHPGREHVHHQLQDMGLSHRGVTVTLMGVNLLLMAAVYLGRNMNVNLALAGLLVLSMAFFPTRKMKRLVLRLLGWKIDPREGHFALVKVEEAPTAETVKKWWNDEEFHGSGNRKKKHRKNGKRTPRHKRRESVSNGQAV